MALIVSVKTGWGSKSLRSRRIEFQVRVVDDNELRYKVAQERGLVAQRIAQRNGCKPGTLKAKTLDWIQAFVYAPRLDPTM